MSAIAIKKRERVEIILLAIKNARPVSGLQSAWELVNHCVNTIEDKYTSIPYNLSNYGSNDRMYFPNLSNIGYSPAPNEGMKIDLIAHIVTLFPNGCICIKVKNTGNIVVSKAGANGVSFCA